MENNPVNHILLSLYNQHNWGDPFEKFKNQEEIDAIKAKIEKGEIRLEYFSQPEIEYHAKNYHNNLEECNDILFDVVGHYEIENYSKEGRIIIFEDFVQQIGLAYYNDFGFRARRGRQFYINIVREIILWHQLGHWITHWMQGSDRNRWDIKSYSFDKQTRDIHEGLAQSFTLYAIINIDDNQIRNEYQQVFHYLLKNQQNCYYKHYEIMSHPKFGWKAMLNGLIMLRINCDSKDNTFDYLIQNMW